MNKLQGKKRQLAIAIENQNWEIHEVDFSLDWWINDIWKIQFYPEANNYFFISFLVDPEDFKDEKIWQFKATSSPMVDRLDSKNEITSLLVSTNNYEPRLKAFINQIKKWVLNSTSKE